MPEFIEWLSESGCQNLAEWPDGMAHHEFTPTKADKDAAWELYTELRSRITTQPLHYLHGDEKASPAMCSPMNSLVQPHRPSWPIGFNESEFTCKTPRRNS